MSRANVPAFTVATGEHFVAAHTHGLTIREYYAAMAMQGLLVGKYYGPAIDLVAKAVQHADALIAELEKPR